MQAVAAQLLEKQLPEIRFQEVALTDVIDFLRDTTQANIFVNWKALEVAGIDRSAPVSTRLKNVKFSKVLRTILESLAGNADGRAWTCCGLRRLDTWALVEHLVAGHVDLLRQVLVC